ncbi:MAG TPA: hypothetical protein VJR24_07895 [Gemmatimonadaceae bacterium]|nr:hypothetical protein [Gemmatimonadaceae bacterium]
MPWTREQQLAALLRLPWTVKVDHDVDEQSLTARVAEIPSAIAVGASAPELTRNLWDSLRASLEVYLDYDDEIPLPPGVKRLPWQADPDSRNIQKVQVTYSKGEAWQEPKADTALVEGREENAGNLPVTA